MSVALSSLPDSELLTAWDTVADHKTRDLILAELQSRVLFPANFIKQWDEDTGAYPSTSDNEFLQKLMAKREFAELVQNEWKPDDNACSDTTKFEVTAVQTFVANLMSPRSPYLSALLYHGVGVGKTCAAVQISEAWLSAYPKDRVYLVAPPTIQEGFYRTIFDVTKMTVGEGPQNPNTQIGCTGNTYLELAGMTFEKDMNRINKRIRKTINQRYNIMGYVQFGNHVEKLLKGIDPELSEADRVQEEYRIINEEFSGKILIIDEAHNVRDITPDPEDEDPIVKEDPTGKKGTKSDMVAGKFMTPFLLKVLEYAQGLKLVLLTATPMYNSYKEIIFMLNLLLKNDKKATITMNMIFDKDTGILVEKGKTLLGLIASRYVSFMRGENPASFPIRLDPTGGVPLLRNVSYPADTPRGNPVPKEELVYKEHLPIVPLELEGDALDASILLTNELKEGDQGISGIELGSIIQAGNFIPPDPDGSDLTLESAKARLGPDGLDALFNRSKGPDIVYTSKIENGSTWLHKDNLSKYSRKFAFLLDQLATAKGVCFVYIRTVALGALPLALALEANGYTLAGRSVGLLGDTVRAAGGRQCALCDKKERDHGSADHSFVKACYGLITGNNTLTPNNTGTINLERQKGNEYGGLMKVIIGSQIAGEGVDLRYIREVHILDTWYHLNRTEQIIGRAIRFCSHSALPKEQRNATIHLYASVFPGEDGRETGDLYSYRVAFRKAVQVGNVTRVLKIRAIDCNLNHDAIIIRNQKRITQIDSKGLERKDVNINDKPFTAICDWNDSCMYECRPKIKVDPETANDSTYSEFAVKWRESKLKDRFRQLFYDQVFYESAQFWNDHFGDVPEAARAELFESVIDNRAFQVTYKNGVRGYIKYCNGYYVFQPNVYLDLHIPMAIRAASFPVKRDFFEPKRYAAAEEAVVEETAPSNLVEIWGAITDWVGEFKELTVEDKISIPPPIQERIEAMSSTEGDVIKKYNDIIDSIDWFRISILKAEKDFDKFNKAVLEYIWDTWFTMKEQIELVEKSPGNTTPMVTGMSTTVGETRVYRYYNPKDASIEYICKNKACSVVIKENVIGKEKDIPKNFLAQGDSYRTGQCYGFLTSDMGVLQFKINQRIKPNEKKALGGVMCKVISSIRGSHYTQLTDLGQILKDAGQSSLDLEYKTISLGSRKIENAIRACTLLELVLRYMDHSNIGRVRWFFRPVEARLIGYKGRFKAGTRSAAPKVETAAAVATVATVAPVATVATKAKAKAIKPASKDNE
jgi:hypothetical protein